MSRSETPNPERRSNSALWCFCVGAALCFGAYVLGIGAVLGAALSGGDPAMVAGSLFAAVAIALAGVSGFLLLAIGGVWLLARVVADQVGDAEERRYRDVDR
jgi:hypothetical protein